MEQVGFEVAAFYRVLPDVLERRSVPWVLRQFEQVTAYQREQVNLQIIVTEIGVGRAVARALGADVPLLETKPQRAVQPGKPAWMLKFEAANRCASKPYS
ncbi:MAG: hypothetical protein JXA21_12320 [Anaerolineae bacterium]|nr:hypothetical protein [Anaerolineae bacterium]